MKHSLLLLLFTFLLFQESLRSQNDTSRFTKSEYQLKLDTVKIQTVGTDFNKSWAESPSMAWKAAIFIGLSTIIVNLIISFFTRKTSINTVEKQIETSFRIASFQYQATLNSSNRQEWINMLREAVADLYTQCRLLNIEFQEPSQSKERRDILHEKLTLSRAKVLLLLKPDDNLHKEFIDLLKELMIALDKNMFYAKHGTGELDNFGFFQKAEKIVEFVRVLLYKEWGKIQDRAVVS